MRRSRRALGFMEHVVYIGNKMISRSHLILEAEETWFCDCNSSFYLFFYLENVLFRLRLADWKNSELIDGRHLLDLVQKVLIVAEDVEMIGSLQFLEVKVEDVIRVPREVPCWSGVLENCGNEVVGCGVADFRKTTWIDGTCLRRIWCRVVSFSEWFYGMEFVGGIVWW